MTEFQLDFLFHITKKADAVAQKSWDYGNIILVNNVFADQRLNYGGAAANPDVLAILPF